MPKKLIFIIYLFFAFSIFLNAQCSGRLYLDHQDDLFFIENIKPCDIDNDGDIDVIMVGNSGINTYLNDGEGNFILQYLYGSAYESEFSINDLDGDGDKDICIISRLTLNKFEILLNNGNGEFTPKIQSFNIDNNDFRSIDLADLDGDGDIDAMFGSEIDSDSLRVYFNDGYGDFTPSYQNLLSNFSVRDIDLADLDGDGDVDAYTTNSYFYDTTNNSYIQDSVHKVLFNDGNGTFSIGNQQIGVSDCSQTELADLNNDGHIDLVSTFSDSINISLNDGTGTFSTLNNLSPLEGLYSINLTDINNDGSIDILINGYRENPTTFQEQFIVKSLLNDSNANFNSSHETIIPTEFTHLAVEDYNGDQLIDAIAYRGGEKIGYYHVLLNGMSLSTNSTPSNCVNQCNGSATVDVINGLEPFTYQWSDNQFQTTSTATNLCPANYTVSVTDSLGCNLNSDITVTQTELTPLPMCVVTVDSNSTKNVVVWEKPITEAIDYFSVYRKLGNGLYSSIANIGYDSLSQFTDSTFGINPNVTSYRYKLSYTDTCGNESQLSDFHETMHLATNLSPNGGINLIWDGYEGIPLSYYRVLRDSTNTNSWEVLDSVSSNVFIWTDINPPTNGAQYTVEVALPYSCTSTRSVDHNTSRSNRGTINGTSSFPPEGDFSANMTQITVGTSVGYYDQSNNDPTNWYWYFSGGTPAFSSLQNPPNITYNTPGIYDVKLVVQNIMGYDTIVKTNYIEVVNGTAPICNFLASVTQVSPSTGIDFLDQSQNQPTNWKWLFEGGTPSISFDQYPTNIVYDSAGTFSVTLIAQNATSADTLSKVDYIEVVTNLSFEEKSNTKIIAFPNPTENSISVDLNTTQLPVQLYLTDLSGRIIENLKATKPTQIIDLSQLSKGVYLLKVSSLVIQKEIKIVKK